MRDYTEAMLDIETLDTEDTTVVYQIGLIVFKQDVLLYSKEFDLSIQEQLDAGRTVSESTLGFHMQSPRGLAQSLHNPMKSSVHTVYEALQNVKNAFRPKYWWSKGRFDYEVLEDLMASYEPVWQWYQKMELRTLIRETGVDKVEPDHTALSDCLLQLNQLNLCRSVINGSARDESQERDQQDSTQADTE